MPPLAMVPLHISAARAGNASRPTAVALISPSGHGNLGDEAIIASAIGNIRRRIPAVRFVGITLRPGDTRNRFGIDAFPIAGVSRPGYLVCEETHAEEPTPQARATGSSPAPTTEPPPDSTRAVWARALGLAKAVVKRVVPRAILWTAIQEARHLRDANQLVRDLDLLVVAGGGQIDDFWGGPWGQPYALFKWSLLARLHGKPIAVASVGFCNLDSPLSRWFTHRALRLAKYRSFRDEGSLRQLERLGHAAGDPVVPDLAFGLEPSHVAPSSSARMARTVCVSPMVYLDPQTWPVKNPAGYAAYLDRLAQVVAGLLADERSVMLVASDAADRRAVAALRERVASRVPPDALQRLSAPPTETVEAFMGATSEAGVLVASRLHGLLLALLAGAPVVALAYDRKVDALMRQMGLEQECLGVDDFSPAEVIARVRSITDEGEPRRRAIAARVAALSQPVREQFDLLTE